MKRIVSVMLLAAVLLTGCGKKKEETVTPPNQGVNDSEYWEASCGEVYGSITEDLLFRVSVEEDNGIVTDLSITPENAWNVRGKERAFSSSFVWSEATQAEWDAQMVGSGELLTITEEGGDAAIWCRSDGNVVCWRTDKGEVQYARAVNPKEGKEVFEGKLYHLLRTIPEDAISAGVWSVVADESLTAEDAAADLLDQVAANYNAVPDWVSWKPEDVVAKAISIYDHYWGEGENFCCGMGFLVKLGEVEDYGKSHWYAGAGLGEADADGYGKWSAVAVVERNEKNDWYIRERGGGGYLVTLPFKWEEATLEELVEAFTQTAGSTHEWQVPYYMLALPESELRQLPEQLDTLPPEQAAELVGLLRELASSAKETGPWVADMLEDVLGKYGMPATA